MSVQLIYLFKIMTLEFHLKKSLDIGLFIYSILNVSTEISVKFETVVFYSAMTTLAQIIVTY